MKLILPTLLLMFIALSARTVSGQVTSCPNPKPLRSICSSIDDRIRVKAPAPAGSEVGEFRYRAQIRGAACVLPTDTKQEANKKIQKMWNTFEDRLICNSLLFDVPNGSILKYGVATMFDEFLQDAFDWGVNLNKIDVDDNRTVLDYATFQMKRYEGNSLERRMKVYRDQLRIAGAKYRSELP